MTRIDRKPETAAKDTFDLIIVGGGIYGAMLSLEATQRRLRPLLIEKGDFGEFTSFNSLRIIHGGFRYLQNLDIHRLQESLCERRWFLQRFSNLVKPLPCLMPLYGNGLRRPFILRLGLRAYEFLSHKRNKEVRSDGHIPPGQIIDNAQTRRIFPCVDVEGLQGGAIWHDAFVADSQRLIMEILHWACKDGATVLNYVEAKELLKDKKNVAGVLAIDHESGTYHEFKAKKVINAGGPWCRDLAFRFDQDKPTLFRSMLAWNILFNRKALSDHALAVTPKKPGGQTYFIVPWKGVIFAGTGHEPWLKDEKDPMPSDEQNQNFIDDLNVAVPELELNQDEILDIFPGLQPATKVGGTRFAKREVIINHADDGGPFGLFSISGVKFTTSRLVAEKTLTLVFPERKVPKVTRAGTFRPSPSEQNEQGIFAFDWHFTANDSNWKDVLRSLIDGESVQHLDDLILRRTTLGDNPERALEIEPWIGDLFDWDDLRCREEMTRLRKAIFICTKDKHYLQIND